MALHARLQAAIVADPLAAFRNIMARAPPDDATVMSDPQWQDAFARAQRAALAQGVEGWPMSHSP